MPDEGMKELVPVGGVKSMVDMLDVGGVVRPKLGMGKDAPSMRELVKAANPTEVEEANKAKMAEARGLIGRVKEARQEQVAYEEFVKEWGKRVLEYHKIPKDAQESVREGVLRRNYEAYLKSKTEGAASAPSEKTAEELSDENDVIEAQYREADELEGLGLGETVAAGLAGAAAAKVVDSVSEAGRGGGEGRKAGGGRGEPEVEPTPVSGEGKKAEPEDEGGAKETPVNKLSMRQVQMELEGVADETITISNKRLGRLKERRNEFVKNAKSEKAVDMVGVANAMQRLFEGVKVKVDEGEEWDGAVRKLITNLEDEEELERIITIELSQRQQGLTEEQKENNWVLIRSWTVGLRAVLEEALVDIDDRRTATMTREIAILSWPGKSWKSHLFLDREWMRGLRGIQQQREGVADEPGPGVAGAEPPPGGFDAGAFRDRDYMAMMYEGFLNDSEKEAIESRNPQEILGMVKEWLVSDYGKETINSKFRALMSRYNREKMSLQIDGMDLPEYLERFVLEHVEIMGFKASIDDLFKNGAAPEGYAQTGAAFYKLFGGDEGKKRMERFLKIACGRAIVLFGDHRQGGYLGFGIDDVDDKRAYLKGLAKADGKRGAILDFIYGENLLFISGLIVEKKSAAGVLERDDPKRRFGYATEPVAWKMAEMMSPGVIALKKFLGISFDKKMPERGFAGLLHDLTGLLGNRSVGPEAVDNFRRDYLKVLDAMQAGSVFAMMAGKTGTVSEDAEELAQYGLAREGNNFFVKITDPAKFNAENLMSLRDVWKDWFDLLSSLQALQDSFLKKEFAVRLKANMAVGGAGWEDWLKGVSQEIVPRLGVLVKMKRVLPNANDDRSIFWSWEEMLTYRIALFIARLNSRHAVSNYEARLNEPWRDQQVRAFVRSFLFAGYPSTPTPREATHFDNILRRKGLGIGVGNEVGALFDIATHAALNAAVPRK